MHKQRRTVECAWGYPVVLISEQYMGVKQRTKLGRTFHISLMGCSTTSVHAIVHFGSVERL